MPIKGKSGKTLKMNFRFSSQEKLEVKARNIGENSWNLTACI